MKSSRIFLAEAFGTFVLVFGGVGAAMFAGKHIGLLGVALAFGLSVMAMAYTVGSISGCHLNPAVTVAMALTKNLAARLVPLYFGAQVVGGILGAGALYVILSQMAGFDVAAGFASTGVEVGSPGGYSMVAGIIAEIIVTGIFITVILGTTNKTFPAGFGGVVVGLTLTLMIMIAGDITNASLNPARSIATAIFQGGWAMDQLWIFIIAPIAGGVFASVLHNGLNGK